ncbi:hypothetical protein LguiB_007577 [Lonicera macranthoides]
MSPNSFHTKRETTTNGLYHQSPLNINKDSHFIKKSPPSSSSSSSSPLIKPQQQRHPVIIYTHSPKIIHTHPRDFMALVQKLTGLSRSDDDPGPPVNSDAANNNNNNNNNVTIPNNNTSSCCEDDDKNIKGMMNLVNDDNDSTSVITDENGGGSSSIGDGQVNSCFVPPTPIFDPPNASCFNNIPFFTPTSMDFLGSTAHPPFYSYTDSIFFMPNNTTTTRSSISSSTLEGMKEFPEY